MDDFFAAMVLLFLLPYALTIAVSPLVFIGCWIYCTFFNTEQSSQ